jgi:ketosteroid isomerase-like protein
MANADLEELRKLNARFIANFVANDVAGHDAILHPQFAYIRANGARVDRASYLAQWATGFDPAIIVYWDTRDEWITVVGDVALVRATNKYVVRNKAGDETGMAAYTDIYLREGGKWLCIQAQITHVEPAHWPSDDSIVGVYLEGVLQKPHG